MKTTLLFYALLIFSLGVFAQDDTLQLHVTGRKNAPGNLKKPYLVVISSDGFRYDYAKTYQAENLLQLASSGVAAESMIPSYPTITRPNHFAIMSGLYPGHSGITGNDFYDAGRKQHWDEKDASFITTEPIWITAEKNKLITASILWPNAIIPIKGILPTYYYDKPEKGDYKLTTMDRVKAFKGWLSLPEETRPHLIMIYLGDTDHEGHLHGPGSPEVTKAIHTVDAAVGRLAEAAKASGLPVNFIFVSDHGMASVDQQHPLVFPKVIDRKKFEVIQMGPAVNLYAKDPADIMPAYEQLKAIKQDDYSVYLKKDIPAQFHYGGKDDRFNRVGDIFLAIWKPQVFNAKPPAGTHGFPNTMPEMHASFYAWGPLFKEHATIPAFENVEVYDLMAHILGITPLKNDGTGLLIKKVLK